MKTGLLNDDRIVDDHVDQSVLLINTPGPGVVGKVFEPFRFADPRVRVTRDVTDQFVDSLHHAAIGRSPVGVIVPAVLGEGDPHSTRERSV